MIQTKFKGSILWIELIINQLDKGKATFGIGHINSENATLFLNPLMISIGKIDFLTIDEEVLMSKVLYYANIKIEFANHTYETTRLYMKRQGIKLESHYNGRNLILLELNNFGFKNAILSDRVHDGTQLNIFHSEDGTEVTDERVR